MTINDMTHGFRVLRAVPLGELDAVLYEMTHERTGLSLVWIKRAEENKTFGIGFVTLPWNDTGVFHILEHSVLCGSDKFPVKEPFVELIKNSMNTFLNALTFPDKTFYPISSRNDKDFLNLMRVYLDAVLHPSIVHKSEIFRQEGWHYEFDENGKPSYKGVVFNEMKGAYADAEELMVEAMNRALLPGTPYAFSYGGDPAHIPELSYEEFLLAHKRFYSPSNAYVVLDGDMEIDTVLRVLDEEYLCDFARGERMSPVSPIAPVDGGVRNIAYEISPEEDEKGKIRMAWGRMIGEYHEREKIIAMQLLSDVLCGSNHAPLSHAVLSQGLCEDISLDINDYGTQQWGKIEVQNVAEENCERVEEVIFSELSRMASEGIDHELLESAMANMEFKMRERDYGSYPQGLIYAFSVLDSWCCGGKPEANLEVGDLFVRLREKMQEGYFETLLREVLLENPHRCKVILTPSHEVGEQRRAAEAERLSAEEQAWSAEEREELLRRQEALLAWQQSEDTPEQLATLPRLELSDIDPMPEKFPLECTEAAGLPVLKHSVACAGIVYTSLFFDVNDFTSQELTELSFLCDLMGRVKTSRTGAHALENRTRLLLGGLGFRLPVFENEATGKLEIKLCCDFSTLEHNVDAALAHVGEILTETVFEREATVLDLLHQNRQSMTESMTMGGHALAFKRIRAQYTPGGAAEEAISGYSCYRRYKEWEDSWNWESMREMLTTLLRRVFTRTRLTVSVTGNADAFAVHIAETMAALLPEGEVGEKAVHALLPHRSEGIVIPADIAFAVRGGNYGSYCGRLNLASKIATYGYLWNAIRVQGGAYGCGLNFTESGVACCYSYRDPDGSASLEKYLKVSSFLRSVAESGEALDGYIIGTVSDTSPLLTARMRGSAMDSLYFRNISYERRCQGRQQLLESKSEDLLPIAERLEKMFAEGSICIVGGQNQIDRCTLDEVLTL